MTVAAHVAAHTHQAEYILCVEGVGWPVDEHDLSDGFQGTVFVTNDINGTLAADLGCTIAANLEVPQSVSEAYSPRSLKYQPGSVTFTLRETASELLLSTFRPHFVGNSGVLQAALEYNNAEVRIDNAVTTWATGDVIWIAGREAVKLGTRTNVAGTVYRYPSSLRGYVGTPRGRYDPVPTGSGEFTWLVNTTIHNYARYWYDRRALLYLHIPGEAPEECVRLAGMRLRTPRIAKQGAEWVFPTATDPTGLIPTRINDTDIQHTLHANEFVNPAGEPYPRPGNSAGYPVTQIGIGMVDAVRRTFYVDSDGSRARNWMYAHYFVGYQYAYRNRVPGGTAGVIAAIDADPTDPQAATETRLGTSRYMMHALLRVGGKHLVRALYKHPIIAGGAEPHHRKIITESANLSLGNEIFDLFQDGVAGEFLLDNLTDSEHNRFRINNSLDGARNPMNILLAFLTSMNNEFYIGDTAAGSSTTAINFTAPGWATDQWAGYALHCVEGTNLGEAREITSNDSDTITVSPAFTNAPAAGAEYQIRNTIYDVLPLGWGMAVHNKDLDLRSFEDVRDRWLGGAEVGRFAVSSKDVQDIWQEIQKNICVPYNILTYVARGTGKLSARYVGSETLQDLLDETYIAVTSSDLLGVGDIDWVPRAPVGQINLKVRDAVATLVQVVPEPVYFGPNGQHFSYAAYGVLAAQPGAELSAQTKTIQIRSAELDDIFVNTELDSIQVSALFNSTLDCAPIVGRLTAKLKREAQPPPECMLTLPLKFLVGSNAVQPGSLISVTDTTLWNPVNPYTGARGWSGMICRVLSTEFAFRSKDLGVRCKVQLLSTITAGKIAPAAVLTAIAGAVLTCAASASYTNDVSSKDWYGLAVGDRIEVRDANGAYKDGPRVIASFGANAASTPEAASTDVINTTTNWVVAWAAGDYVTFSPWSGSNTSNMDTYAAYADADGNLTGGDAGRKYA